MFLGLNKKIILAIVAFFIFCFTIFGYTLYSLYNSKLQEDQIVLHQKNQQYNELLYHYNLLKSENIHQPSLITKPHSFEWYRQDTLRAKNLLQNLHLAITSLAGFSILIILMIIFLHNLILEPITHISKMNQTILKGVYNERLNLPYKLVKDEFNDLQQTYNRMLDNIEEQITHINEQKEFLQNILNGIPDAIRVFDFEGNIILNNTAYQKKLEHSADISKKRHKCYESLLQRKTPCSAEIESCPLHTLKQKNNIKFIQELPFTKKRYVSINAARIDTTRQPLIIESLRDLSEDIKFSHQQKISSLGFLTAAIAHEIKNNLGSMRLIMESLQNGKFSKAEQQKYSTLLYEQLLECIKIPERLLKIAQATPDKAQKISCKESISEICALLDYEATRNGIKLSIEAEENIPPIYGNETDFKMIILNLAQNAIKAMPQGGKLTFQLSADTKNVSISITDTGCGIPKKQLPHIFEPFVTHSKDGKHTGLGLAIVKSLVNDFMGEIKVDSKLKKGTSFCLKIPHKNKK